MERVGSLEDWALETPDGLEAFEHMSFHEAYGKFWQVPIFFSSAVGHDRRLNSFVKSGVVYHLGAIAGINEMLLEDYFHGLADKVLDRPENVKEYAKIMLRLKALYEDYRSREKVRGADLRMAVEDILSELYAFAQEILNQLRAQR